MTGRLVVSLDFELHWGLRDHTPVERCRAALHGVWRAVPAMLEAFWAYDVHATWATVGMLFARDREELEASLPAVRPAYRDPALSPYLALHEVGRDEDDDPFHFAPSLIRAIADTPGQELGTHTFGHYYCLEPGGTLDAWRADLTVALTLARRQGHELRSIVFPRNQYDRRHLEVLPELGITAYRGAAPGWMYEPLSGDDERRRRRVLRLADAYLPLGGTNVVQSQREPGIEGLVNVPASRFLRPYHPRLRHLDRLRLERIRRAMTIAARSGQDFHLWWHPHNLGTHLEESLGLLRRLLDHHAWLRERHGMESVSMGERAAELRSLAAK